MANLLQSAQVEQISADSGIPSVSLHQRGLVLVDFRSCKFNALSSLDYYPLFQFGLLRKNVQSIAKSAFVLRVATFRDSEIPR